MKFLKQLIDLQTEQTIREQDDASEPVMDYKQHLVQLIDDGKISVLDALEVCMKELNDHDVRDMLEKIGLVSHEHEHEEECDHECEEDHEDEECEDVSEDYRVAHEWDIDQQKIEHAIATALELVRSSDWTQYVKDAEKFFGHPMQKMAADAYAKLFQAAVAYKALAKAMSEINK